MGTVIYDDDDGGLISVSMTETVSVTAGFLAGPDDDDGSAGVGEPLRPNDVPPSLAAEAQADEG